MGKQAQGAGGGDGGVQPLQLRTQHGAARSGEPVVAAALVVREAGLLPAG